MSATILAAAEPLSVGDKVEIVAEGWPHDRFGNVGTTTEPLAVNLVMVHTDNGYRHIFHRHEVEKFWTRRNSNA